MTDTDGETEREIFVLIRSSCLQQPGLNQAKNSNQELSSDNHLGYLLLADPAWEVEHTDWISTSVWDGMPESPESLDCWTTSTFTCLQMFQWISLTKDP